MKEHGHVDIKFDGNILILSVHGPFNIEAVESSLREIKNLVNQKENDFWYRVDFLDEDTLGPPEAMKAIGEFYLWADKNGCRATAVACSNSLQKVLMDSFISASDINVKTFMTQTDAIDYIKQQV